MKAPETARTPAEYLDRVPAKRQADMRALHDSIVTAAPHLKPEICHGMIGYGVHPYRSKSGCEGEWFKVGLASRKQAMSLHISVCDDEGYPVERAKDRLGKVSVGKSCIRFTKLENLNLDVAMELVRLAALEDPRKAG